MKRRSVLVTTLVLGLALTAVAQTAPVKASKSNVPHAAAKQKKEKAHRTDASMQECIQQKIAMTSRLKNEPISVAVENGTARFTGTVRNAGSKGGVVSIARSCGTRQVTNDITVEAMKKPAPKAKTGAPHK